MEHKTRRVTQGEGRGLPFNRGTGQTLQRSAPVRDTMKSRPSKAEMDALREGPVCVVLAMPVWRGSQAGPLAHSWGAKFRGRGGRVAAQVGLLSEGLPCLALLLGQEVAWLMDQQEGERGQQAVFEQGVGGLSSDAAGH